MSLTFHFATPGDLLAKLKRDLARLNDAVSTGDREPIADCLFDFTNTCYSIKDWLKANTNARFSPTDVEDYVKDTQVLDACRDICNANKHHIITCYSPTDNVYESLTANPVAAPPFPRSGLGLEASPQPDFRVKVLLTDGTKFEVTDLADRVVRKWERFFSAKGVTPAASSG